MVLPRPLFETCAVKPTGHQQVTGFRSRASGCRLETWTEAVFPYSPEGGVLQSWRKVTATPLREVARLLELSVIEVASLENGRRKFARVDDWARATEIIKANAREHGRLRWDPKDPGFVYPPAACKSAEDCPACPLFQCARCKRDQPWCVGAADEMPDWCDACVDAYGFPVSGTTP